MSRRGRFQTKAVTICFDPVFLKLIDQAAKAADYGRRNDYIKAVLRKEIAQNFDTYNRIASNSDGAEVEYE